MTFSNIKNEIILLTHGGFGSNYKKDGLLFNLWEKSFFDDVLYKKLILLIDEYYRSTKESGMIDREISHVLYEFGYIITVVKYNYLYEGGKSLNLTLDEYIDRVELFECIMSCFFMGQVDTVLNRHMRNFCSQM